MAATVRARRVRLLAAALALAGSCTAGAAGLEHEVRDPHYGDTLFHFFQDHYFTAVTTLMASQHFNRVSRHDDEAEVLRGGMLLSYGQTREAGDIFARLIERGAQPPVRDRAWFYLAKIRYQRGYLAEAEAALAKVEQALPGALEEERLLLAAHLLMARDDHAGAARILDGKAGRTPGARYVRYNLGVALLRSGDVARGSAVLDELGRQGAENEEYRALRDRANLALGFAALADARPKEARTYLERVRLKSLSANKALLGFGWAADSLKEPKLALVPWAELAGRDFSDSAVLEAQIAVPYAFAELGAYAQSLDGYNAAIASFEREGRALRESIEAIRKGALLEALVERNPGDEMGWFWSIGELPTGMPHARHLAQVLARHEFQEALKNYRDLRFLARNLDEWKDKLGTFGDMLATRRKAFAQKLPPVQGRPWQVTLDALHKRRDGLAGEIAAGESAGDGEAFADDRETALLARLQSARQAVDALAAMPGADAETQADLVRTRERLRIASGVLAWQLSQARIDRAWTLGKELASVDAGLVGASRRDAALAEAQRTEPARFEAFRTRIAALDPRLGVLIPHVASLGQEQRVAAQEIAVAELTRQQHRLAAYETQARFAVAQLYDRAYAKGIDGTAKR
ncbi:MAG TPA: tetratricopeptide repeat protein [Caldimonas sp.]|jgi:hypothetical protein|nr:tetratricopeptide repeat protein [Caldimonas sp.]HEX2540133.1 tetratricopeptide repeat protein [Caldimonas sp.]